MASLVAEAPDRAHRVHHPASRELPCRRRYSRSRNTLSHSLNELFAFFKNHWPASRMNRAVDATSSCKCRVRGVHYDVRLDSSDVAHLHT